MPMLTSRQNTAIRFNSDYFDDQAIDRLMALRAPAVPAAAAVAEPRLLPLFGLPAFQQGDAKALFDANACQTALSESLAILMEDPDYRREIEQGGKDALMEDARRNLTTQLTTGSVDAAVADNNEAARHSVRIVTDPGGIMALEVAGTRLLTVDPALLRGPSFALIMQVAAVVLDIFALVCTAIGIAIKHGSGWIRRVAEYIKGIGKSMVDWAVGMLGKAGAWMSELRAAHGGPGWMTSVKAYGKRIVNFVIVAMKEGWKRRQFINAIRHCYDCLFAEKWYKKAYYLLQLIGSIVLMVATAGAGIALKLLLAVVQLALLVWDSIVLHDMLGPEPQA